MYKLIILIVETIPLKPTNQRLNDIINQKMLQPLFRLYHLHNADLPLTQIH